MSSYLFSGYWFPLPLSMEMRRIADSLSSVAVGVMRRYKVSHRRHTAFVLWCEIDGVGDPLRINVPHGTIYAIPSVDTSVDRGRPRQFDEQHALTAAMQVFWRDGYRGASIAALTEAMGINKPSLYSAFGGKQALYLRALEHYVESEAAAQVAALDSGTSIRDAISSFLRAAVSRACNNALPGGCYIVNAMADSGTDGTPPEVSTATQQAFQRVGAALKTRLTVAKRCGELRLDADIPGLTNYFAIVMAGAMVMSRNGTSRAALNAVIEQSLHALPIH